MIRIKDLYHEFFKRNENGDIVEHIHAVNGITMDIKQGEFVAILGHNGSGKSTLAKHLNGILQPTKGTVYVSGLDIRDEDSLLSIRKQAGMVFQNPDNQIVGTLVEEDVAFGLENIGVPTEEIWKRVEQSLETVGMSKYRHHSPMRLSGGQKQRVAIAGIVSMEPDCIIFDEPTAMLDPMGRKDVMEAILSLNKEKNITIILITHNMEEVVQADTIYVMDQGKVVEKGKPTTIFSKVEEMKSYGLEVPFVTEIAYELKKEGIELKEGILTVEELVKQLCQFD